MFLLSQFLLNNAKTCDTYDKLVTYSIITGLVLYTSTYLYFLFYKNEYLGLFNKFIIYIITIDLLLSTAYHLLVVKKTTEADNEKLIENDMNIILDDEDDEDDEDEEDDEDDEDNEDDDECTNTTISEHLLYDNVGIQSTSYIQELEEDYETPQPRYQEQSEEIPYQLHREIEELPYQHKELQHQLHREIEELPYQHKELQHQLQRETEELPYQHKELQHQLQRETDELQHLQRESEELQHLQRETEELQHLQRESEELQHLQREAEELTPKPVKKTRRRKIIV